MDRTDYEDAVEQMGAASIEEPKRRLNKKQIKEADIVTLKMEEFMEHKRSVPPPVVIHDKEEPFC